MAVLWVLLLPAVLIAVAAMFVLLPMSMYAESQARKAARAANSRPALIDMLEDEYEKLQDDRVRLGISLMQTRQLLGVAEKYWLYTDYIRLKELISKTEERIRELEEQEANQGEQC